MASQHHKFCDARVNIPHDLAPLIWGLVGGSDAADLRRGIIKACEIATGTSDLWNNSDEQLS
jgi:ethanolamine utilization microcompartment shell protein EutL